MFQLTITPPCKSYFFVLLLFFILIRFFIIIILFTFAAVERNVFIHQGISKVRKYFYFLATFKALYLAVSNILLTHTHTHKCVAIKHALHIISYARNTRAVILINKGLIQVPFVSLFMS